MRQVLAVTVLLTATACGGGGGDAGEGADPATTAVAPLGSGVPADAVEFCAINDAFFAVSDELDRLRAPLDAIDAGRYAEAVEPMREVYAALEQGRGALDHVEAVAPAEISADVAALVAWSRSLLDTLPDRDELLDALEAGDAARVEAIIATFKAASNEILGATEIQPSGQRVQQYIIDHC